MATSYNMTTTSEVNAGVEAYFHKVALTTPKPKYIYELWAEGYDIPSNNSTVWKARRYNRLAAATVKLAEGITPNGSKLAKVDLLASVDQYGDWIMVSDVVVLTTDGMVLAKEAEMQADQVQNTRDQLCRDVMNATASVLTCSHGTPTATLLNKTDIDVVATTLFGNLAEHITDYVKASPGVGTAPLRPAYVGLFHYLLRENLSSVSGFIGTQQYPQQNFLHTYEWGSTGEVRWIMSTQAPVASGVYSNLIFGKEAYSKINLSSGRIENYVSPPGSGVDYLRQRTVAGWKMWAGWRLLQDLFIINLKSTKS